MNLSRLVALTIAGACVLAPVATAQYETIVFESFDYPAGNLGGQAGGSGWSNSWWAGNNGDAGLVDPAGIDLIGGKLDINISNEGCYRLIDLRGLDKIVDQGAIGSDGTEIWLSQWSQRQAPGDDTYGHIILNWQWVMEGLCVGSPHAQIEWGVEQPWVSPPQFVPNTSCDVLTNLVAKVDFLPGDEHVQLWLDPPVTHPDPLIYPPDLDMWVIDFRFNEIGLKSGDGFGTGAPEGFDFDGIEVSTPNFRPVLAASNVIGGQTANVDITNCEPGNNVIIGYSLAGGGPFPTQYGDAALTPPINQIGPIAADPNGEIHITAGIPSALSGSMIWAQCLELIVGGHSGGVLSNPLALTVG